MWNELASSGGRWGLLQRRFWHLPYLHGTGLEHSCLAEGWILLRIILQPSICVPARSEWDATRCSRKASPVPPSRLGHRESWDEKNNNKRGCGRNPSTSKLWRAEFSSCHLPMAVFYLSALFLFFIFFVHGKAPSNIYLARGLPRVTTSPSA